MSVVVRAATKDDVSFIAKMILQSTRAGKLDGLFDVIFEDVDEKVILENIEKLTQANQKNPCSYQNFLIGVKDNRSVGTLCAYEPRFANNATFFKALIEIGCDENIEERLGFLHDCEFELNNRTLLLDYMEEVDDYVDVGVLKALMHKALLTARLKGYRIAQTIVETGSLETILFYETLGFKKVDSRECDSYKERFGRHGFTLLKIEF